MKKIYINTILISAIVLIIGVVGLAADASHSWGNYHWARKSNPFTLKLGDNVSSNWDVYLGQASSGWSQSSVLDTLIVEGKARVNCRPTSGRIEVCSKTYGNNGWLGLAQIWVSGNHITQGTTKLNDTYFNTSTYNTAGWRSLVICQETGHGLGLDHQDENFNNAPIIPHTCMDYFVPDANELVGPNAHDYEQLESIYAHLDSTTTIKSDDPFGKGKPNDADLENPSEWGKSLRQDGSGRDSMFVRDLGEGKKVFTFVFWTR